MSPNRKRRSRRELLINGRRVRMADLVEANLLRAGTELAYQQRIGMKPHRAVVTDRNRLKLADGRQFDTPSAAAAAAANITAAPGWSVWRVGLDGPTLHELRQRLLRTVADEVAEDKAAPKSELKALHDRFQQLNDAQKKAEAGRPKELTVRELLALWGSDTRDPATSMEIDADLANHDLTTVPDFRAVSLDRTVQIVRQPLIENDQSVEPPSAGHRVSISAENEETSRDIGLVLEHLLGSDHVLGFVKPTASIEEAITAMQLDDYSQLAVLPSPHKLHGVVTWKSIAEARNLKADAALSDAIVMYDHNVFDYDTRLLSVLPNLQRDGFVFVRDFERKIVGIVTNADVVGKYNETATPFFLIGEVDQELRQLIQNNIDEDSSRKACSKTPFDTYESMTMWHYQQVLDNPDCWKQLCWAVDRRMFVERLGKIRKLRNVVMHFNPEPIAPAQVEQLKIFLDLIRKYSN
jgi:predicted transcriptional regulator